jgi:hypothetical protein
VDRDHRAEAASLGSLATVGKPVIAVAFRTDGSRLDVGGADTRPVQEQPVGRRQGEPEVIAVRLEGLVGVGPGYPPPIVDNVCADVVAAAANRRTENNSNVVNSRAKGRAHDGKGCTNNIRDGSPPPSVNNADGRAAPPGSWVNDQHRLAVGVQGHQHRAALVRHQCIAKPNLSRSWSRAVPGVRLPGEVDIPSMYLTQRDQVFRFETQRGAPMLAHCPGVVPVTRRTEPDVAMRASQTFDTPGQSVRHPGNG